jgi:hypothetical protein
MRVSIDITDAPAAGTEPVQLQVREQEQLRRAGAGAEFDGGPDTAAELAEGQARLADGQARRAEGRARTEQPSPAGISGGSAPGSPQPGQPGTRETATPWIVERGVRSPT